MTKFLDYEGLQKFKECADAKYLPQKGTIPITDKINLTSENALTLGAKVAKVANNSMNFYIIADSQGKLPSSETRINIPSSITSLVGAEGANVGDIFVVAKLNSLPVYRIIPLNDAKAANDTYAGTNGVMTPWDKSRVNKVDSIEGTANNALNKANNALNNLPTLTETNMNNALATGVYPWCTLGRPDGSTGAYTLLTLASTTQDSAGYTTIEQTAYGRQNDELGKVFKRIIFKKGSEVQFGDWLAVAGGSIKNKVKTYVVNKNSITLTSDTKFHFNIPDDMVGSGILDIRAVLPCFIMEQGDTSINLDIKHYFPLSALGYRINYAPGISNTGNVGSTGHSRIEIVVNNNIVYNSKDCNISLARGFYIEIDYIPMYSTS
jgi:hypothetical protein|nr:MAG TPA: hypothetical protein [Crassvirales sp.]